MSVRGLWGALRLAVFSWLLLAGRSPAFGTEGYDKEFIELKRLETSVLELLRFRYHEKFQIKSNNSYKLVLEDQIGDLWLFKAGAHSAKDGAHIVYQIYSYLGVDTPETFLVTLPINGQPVPGSLQRLIRTRPRREHVPYCDFSAATHHYLFVNHLLSWLILNNHVHPGQFVEPLVTDAQTSELVRIDNSINWFLIDEDGLGPYFTAHTVQHIPRAGFQSLWLSYLSQFDLPRTASARTGKLRLEEARLREMLKPRKKIQLEAAELLAVVELYQALPDEFLRGLFAGPAATNFSHLANPSTLTTALKYPTLVTPERVAAFVDKLLVRKAKARDNYLAFLEDLSRFTQIPVPRSSTLPRLRERNLKRFREKRQQLEKTRQTALHAATEPQADIRVALSFRLYEVIESLSSNAFVQRPQDRIHHLKKIQQALREITVPPQYPQEQAARERALKNMAQLTSEVEETDSFLSVYRKTLHFHELFE